MSLGTHSYAPCPLTLAQSHRFLPPGRPPDRIDTPVSPSSHVLAFTLLCPPVRSRSSLSHVHHQYHTHRSPKTNKTPMPQEFHFFYASIQFKNEGERRKKTKHPPSNTVYAEWSRVLWWQSIYTWEEGNWYWDRSNMAAHEALPPGKLEKSCCTAVEETVIKGCPITSHKRVDTVNRTQQTQT